MHLTDRRPATIAWTMLVAAGVYIVAAPLARAADTVFAQNYLTGSKQVVTYPVGDPGSTTILGPLTDTLVGMDFDPGASVLWAINFTTHALGTVNQTTGAFALATVLADSSINAFTIDPVGTFYVSKSDHFIYGLNPASGETTVLGVGAPADSTIGALAAACSGAVFVLANNGMGSDTLYRFEPSASNYTPVGSTGYTGATSVEFDNHSGTLYAWFNASGDTTSTHATIDTATGAASQTAVLSGRYRMAIRNECSIFMDDFEA